MGNQDLEPISDVSEGYKVISYLGSHLPPEFTNVIIAPFINSLRYGNDLFKLVDQDSYYKAYSKYIGLLLMRPKSVIKLALLNDKTVLGWSLYEDEILHYVWVKKEVRRQGIARALLPMKFTSISHITNKGLNIWVNKFPEVRFNPFV